MHEKSMTLMKFKFLPFSQERLCGRVQCSIFEHHCHGKRSAHRDPVAFHPFESSPTEHWRLFSAPQNQPLWSDGMAAWRSTLQKQRRRGAEYVACRRIGEMGYGP